MCVCLKAQGKELNAASKPVKNINSADTIVTIELYFNTVQHLHWEMQSAIMACHLYFSIFNFQNIIDINLENYLGELCF